MYLTAVKTEYNHDKATRYSQLNLADDVVHARSPGVGRRGDAGLLLNVHQLGRAHHAGVIQQVLQ